MSPRRHGDAGGSLRVFRQFAWLEVGSVKAAFSRPAHQRVTHTVRPYAFFLGFGSARNEQLLSLLASVFFGEVVLPAVCSARPKSIFLVCWFFSASHAA